MKTKSGKSHYTADVEIIWSDGTRHVSSWKFCTSDPQKYIEDYKKRAFAIGNKAVNVTNLVNLDT